MKAKQERLQFRAEVREGSEPGRIRGATQVTARSLVALKGDRLLLSCCGLPDSSLLQSAHAQPGAGLCPPPC